MKFLFGLICLFSMPAFACNVENARTWFFQEITPAGLSGYCRDHGNAVTSIVVQNGEGTLVTDPSTVLRQFAITCEDGTIRLGTMSSDSSTCNVKNVSTDKSIKI